jgi:Holliday junction resolvase-like predicted endonuclease
MSLPFPARIVNRLTAHQRGWLAEKLALSYFLAQGFTPAPRRARERVQTDLLLIRGQTLLLVEVKFRQTELGGHVALTPTQRRRLQRAARALVGHYPSHTIRADVVAVFPRWPFLRHLPAAIALD